MTSRPNAAEKVFAISELLESVLLLLPARDILLLQRVNTFFNSTITGSKQLQRALFLRKDFTSSPSLWLEADYPDYTPKLNRIPDLNPLLTQAHDDYHELIFEYKGKYYFMLQPPLRELPTNPLPRSEPYQRHDGPWTLILSLEELSPASVRRKQQTSGPSSSSSSCSWADMYLSQPVCDIHISLWKSDPPRRRMTDLKRMEVKGGTLRQVLQQVGERQRAWERRGWREKWREFWEEGGHTRYQFDFGNFWKRDKRFPFVRKWIRPKQL